MADWKQDKPIIKREDVLMVYSGLAGCMCGCLGNYRYPKANAELGKAQRGYEIKPEEFNEGQVTRVLAKLASLNGVEVGEIYGKAGDSLYVGRTFHQHGEKRSLAGCRRTMDPNANLKEMLELAATIQEAYEDEDGNGVDQDDANRLAELVLAMHEWLGHGGFKPNAWGR